jgi:hypothetical protein
VIRPQWFGRAGDSAGKTRQLVAENKRSAKRSRRTCARPLFKEQPIYEQSAARTLREQQQNQSSHCKLNSCHT